MAELKGGLIGFGAVAQNAHAPALAAVKGLRVAAVAESVPARLAAAQKEFPGAALFSSADEMLAAGGLDFVVVATPPRLHGALTLKALRAGCHVLCEKPLTLERGQFDDIRREAQDRGLAAFTMHNWARSPQWLKIFELVDSGVIGELSFAQLRVLRAKPAADAGGGWRADPAQSGGGILVDHGWHALYLLHRLFKAAPSKVTARLSGPEGAEETAHVSIDFKSAEALIELSWRADSRSNTAKLVGSKGELLLEDDRIVLDGRTFEFPQRLSAGSAHPDWTQVLLADFIRAVEDPKARAANLEEAAFCLSVIDQAYSRREVAAQ